MFKHDSLPFVPALTPAKEFCSTANSEKLNIKTNSENMPKNWRNLLRRATRTSLQSIPGVMTQFTESEYEDPAGAENA